MVEPLLTRLGPYKFDTPAGQEFRRPSDPDKSWSFNPKLIRGEAVGSEGAAAEYWVDDDVAESLSSVYNNDARTELTELELKLLDRPLIKSVVVVNNGSPPS
ncbi:hypothetical protein HK102_005515 [Quaeritorhiza haematococci]|nr:hypothetical protein HK102_005515 [Quaeritorhiza haematococci]